MTPADDREPGGDDLVAAEYVLGVLPARDRQAAAGRIDSDPAFARLVEEWEARLSPMAAGYGEVEPPVAVKQALDRRLFSAASAASVPARTGLWRSLALWRGIAAAAVAALVAALAVSYMAPLPGAAPRERFAASLTPKDSDVRYLVVYDASTHEIGLSHVGGERPPGQDFELWVIDGGQPPQSLGVIPVGSNVHLQVSQAVRSKIESGAVFAISTEPPGGSPTGLPTGPVVALGDLRSI